MLELGRPTARSVGRLLTLVIIALLAVFLRVIGSQQGALDTTMLLGFLLLAAYVSGELAREFALPRITGYLVIGLLLGPHVFGLLPKRTVEDFTLINWIALSVIALQAGGELRVANIRERFRGIAWTTALQVAVTIVGVGTAVYWARDFFPFLLGQPNRTVVAVALIFAVVSVANSPATTIAVITEERAKGAVTDTVLGVSVVKDVVILLLVGVMLPTAELLVDPAHGFDFGKLGQVSLQIVIALAMGAGVGALIGLYLVRVGRQPILFVLALAFVIVELAQFVGFERELSILMGMSAGFVVQNFSGQGAKMLEALEANALPLYALFFAVAAAGLDLSVIPSIWRAGLVIIVARLALIYISTRAGAKLAGEPDAVRDYAWMGFVAQAGVTLGLAIMVNDRFSVWGGAVSSIIIAMIAVNQLIGPPLFRLALTRAGEARAGRREAEAVATDERHVARATR